jgi:hypothetical protein
MLQFMIHNLYSSPTLYGKLNEGGWDACNTVARKHDRRYYMRKRHRLEDDNKMGLKETACENVDWTHLAQHWDQQQVLMKHDNEALGSSEGRALLNYLSSHYVTKKSSAPWN